MQRAWIKRKEAPGELGSCRPSKRHRLGAKHWCQGLDNTLRRSTPLGGLGAFALPPPEKRSGHWEAWPRWPHLLLTIDQGSDGLCGASFLRSQDLNLSVLPDMSHAANNDFVDGCKDVGLYKFIVLMLVPMNLEHGPFLSDLRFNQCRESWSAVARHFTPVQMPLFLEKTQHMLEEVGGESALHAEVGDGAIDDCLWRRMVQGWAPRGAKANLHRFFDARMKTSEFLSWWSSSLCKYEYVALQQGLLADRRMVKLVIQEQASAEQGAEMEASTSGARVCLSEKALRSCCSNSLAISVMVLGERWNYYLARLVCEVSAPLAAWHFSQNRELRSSHANHHWIVTQLEFGFMGHVVEILGRSSDVAALQACGLTLDVNLAPSARNGALTNNLTAEMEDLADLFGELAMCMGSRRIARCSFLVRGWPLRLAGLCGSPELQHTTVSAFERDHKNFQVLANRGQKSKGMVQLEKRSAFTDVSVRQFVQAFRCTTPGKNSKPRIAPPGSMHRFGFPCVVVRCRPRGCERNACMVRVLPRGLRLRPSARPATSATTASWSSPGSDAPESVPPRCPKTPSTS